MEIPVLKDNDFKFFQDLIFQLAGLSMSAAKKPLVGNRLVTRLRYYELKSYEEYVHILRNPHND